MSSSINIDYTNVREKYKGRILRLFSSGLTSKWGFDDGDVLGDFKFDHGQQWKDVDVREALVQLVHTYLYPKMQENHKYEYMVIESIHNPIRVTSIDGVDVDLYDSTKEYGITPEYVDVPWEHVGKIFDEIKRRSQ